MILTNRGNLAYCIPAGTQLSAGISTPIHLRATALIRRAFFATPAFGWLYGGSSERRPQVGSTNSVQSVILRLVPKFDRSLTQPEDRIMSSPKSSTPDAKPISTCPHIQRINALYEAAEPAKKRIIRRCLASFLERVEGQNSLVGGMD